MRVLLLLAMAALLGAGCMSPDLHLDDDEPTPEATSGRHTRGIPTTMTPTEATPTPTATVPVPTPTEASEPDIEDEPANETENVTIHYPPHEAVIHLVSIFAKDGGYEYRPDTTEFIVTDSIRWRNESSVNHAFNMTGAFSYELLEPHGGVFAYTFKEPGNYTLTCFLHPHIMDRTLHVVADPNAEPAEP